MQAEQEPYARADVRVGKLGYWPVGGYINFGGDRKLLAWRKSGFRLAYG